MRKRNANNALPFNKNFTRIQVSANSQTFKTVKTAVSKAQTNRILTQAGDFLNTESGDRLTLD